MLNINDLRRIALEREEILGCSKRRPPEEIPKFFAPNLTPESDRRKCASDNASGQEASRIVSGVSEKMVTDQPRRSSASNCDLSSPDFLSKQLSPHSEFDNQDMKLQSQEDSAPSYGNILLMHPVYSSLLPALPMSTLCRLACVSRDFSRIVAKECTRPRRQKIEHAYRPDFIRIVNLSYLTRRWIPSAQVFAPLLRDLFITPQHVLVFYSPDIFQYSLRILDKNGSSQLAKMGDILDDFWNEKDSDLKRVWHFRLFSVIKPDQPAMEHSSLSHHELNRMHLWHSEDLAVVFIPRVDGVEIHHEALTFGTHFGSQMILGGGNILSLILALARRYVPKFLLITLADAQRIPQGFIFNFPIIVFDARTFEGSMSEEWMCFSGKNVAAYQVVLERNDSRERRDEKIRALKSQLDSCCPKYRQLLLFYFTEMWPGGTSKEVPQCDVLTLRCSFPGKAIFGGRAKQFAGNQFCPSLNSAEENRVRSLTFLPIPTVVTIVAFV